MKRATFLKSIGALAGAATLDFSFAGTFDNKNKKSFRIAHITDVHILPRANAIEGTAKALEQVHALKQKPDYVFFGGDCIMDALATPKDKVKEMWKLWDDTVKKNLKIPAACCLGNHDVFGWGSTAEEFVKDPLYGKQWAMDELEMKNRFYSFDKGNWHFIILDNIHIGQGNTGYMAKLDDEQFSWLSHELENTPKENFVCILSHIPIVTVCPFYDKSSVKEFNFDIGAGWQNIDSLKIKDLFNQYKNVKVCLSGHTHMVDQINYLGTSYMTNGAVCGNWWDGVYKEFAPAYTIIDLYDDGTFERQMINY
ncbi:MAG: metallophosphoesterase [Bacteroidia bacterium]